MKNSDKCQTVYGISVFDNNKDTIAKEYDFTYEQLLRYFNTVKSEKFTHKDNLKGIVYGTFKGGKRKSENIMSRSIISYDLDYYDKNMQSLVDYIVTTLKDYTYIYYSTTSSTEEKPKLRLLLFIDIALTFDEYKIVAENVAKDLLPEFFDVTEHVIDSASYSAAQMMYVPTNKNLKRGYNKANVIVTSKYKVKSEVSLENFKPKLDITDEQVLKYLSKYDVKKTEYHERLMVCHALHHQYAGNDKGLEIYENWSLGDDRRTEEYIRSKRITKYKSSGKTKGKNIITFASVIKAVNDLKLPAHVKSREFDPISLDDDIFVDFKYNKKFEKIGVKSTYANFEAMCNHYGIKISFDIITKENVNSLDEKNQNSLNTILKSLMILNGMDKGSAIDYVHLMANSNTINSFKIILDNVEWDGVDRLPDFYNTLTVDDMYIETRNLYLQKWLQQMLYLSLHDGKRKIPRNLLILQGNQGCGKSTWVKSLLPEHLSKYVGEGLHLNTSDSMSVLSCIKKLFVELSELEQSFKKTDINQFKAFFGRTKDELNIKYLAEPVTHIRTTSFIGTVNDVVFLKDKTGSTRFLVLPVLKLNGYHKIDMLQLYKQIIVTTDYADFELSTSESARQGVINEDFEQPDIIDEQFIDVFETEFNDGGTYLNCKEVLDLMGYSNKDIRHNTRCDVGNVLRKYNFKYRKNTKKYLLKLKNKEISL